MLYETPPAGFNPRFEVVGCFIESGGKILLLHRQDNKPEGDTWGMPAGKVNANETINATMSREIREETGLDIPPPQPTHCKRFYVKYPTYDFTYHIFHIVLPQRPNKIKLNPKEHKDFKWLEPAKAQTLPLIEDLDGCINFFYNLPPHPAANSGKQHIQSTP